MFARVVAGPTISALADRAPDRVPILVGLAILAAGAAAGYLLTPSYALVLVISIVFGIFWGPHTPLADSLALSGVRRYGCDYAGMRLWGSVAYFCANAAGGWAIGRAGAGAFPWLLLGGLLGIAAIGLFAPRIGRPRQPALQPAEALPAAAAVFRSPYFLLFLAASALVQSSHAELYAFGTIYWKSVGIGGTAIGLLWSFAVMAEVVMFLIFRRLSGRLSSARVLAVAAALGVARWALYPFAWPLGLGLPGFFLLQGLHAFSFSAGFLATQRMLAETVPEDRIGAAQGAFYFAPNVLLALFTLAAGPLYAALGIMSFEVMAAVAGIGLVLAAICMRLERRVGNPDRPGIPKSVRS
jgi:PPP family 3-phenylpropionic acid transporter